MKPYNISYLSALDHASLRKQWRQASERDPQVVQRATVSKSSLQFHQEHWFLHKCSCKQDVLQNENLTSASAAVITAAKRFQLPAIVPACKVSPFEWAIQSTVNQFWGGLQQSWNHSLLRKSIAFTVGTMRHPAYKVSIFLRLPTTSVKLTLTILTKKTFILTTLSTRASQLP